MKSSAMEKIIFYPTGKLVQQILLKNAFSGYEAPMVSEKSKG
jgi:hypothetical protein